MLSHVIYTCSLTCSLALSTRALSRIYACSLTHLRMLSHAICAFPTHLRMLSHAICAFPTLSVRSQRYLCVPNAICAFSLYHQTYQGLSQHQRNTILSSFFLIFCAPVATMLSYLIKLPCVPHRMNPLSMNISLKIECFTSRTQAIIAKDQIRFAFPFLLSANAVWYEHLPLCLSFTHYHITCTTRRCSLHNGSLTQFPAELLYVHYRISFFYILFIG